MNKLYANQKLSTYVIGKELGLTTDYLYKYIRGISRIENMPSSILLRIAKLEEIEPNELYSKMLVAQMERGKVNKQ